MYLYAHKTAPTTQSTPTIQQVGFGLGPTLEFYTLVSKQLQLYRLNMWIGVSCRHNNNNNNNNNKGKNNKGGDDDDDVYVLPPSSYLHPKPIPYYKKNNNNNGDEERVLELFEFLGRFMAKSLVDYRLVCVVFIVFISLFLLLLLLFVFFCWSLFNFIVSNISTMLLLTI